MICLEWEATPVTHFYSLDPRTKGKQELMENAIRVAVAAPECNHLDFSFKRPERAIMKIFDAYVCEKSVKGSWWLVKGPDRSGSCLISWAYLDPHKMRSSIGWTQHQFTDYNVMKGATLHGAIYQDSSICNRSYEYDVNLLIKDPASQVHRIFFDAKKEQMDSPMLFTLYPNSTKEKTYFSDIFTDSTGRECDDPYCTKLVIDPVQSEFHKEYYDNFKESEVPKTLAFVLIDQRFFDPIKSYYDRI